MCKDARLGWGSEERWCRESSENGFDLCWRVKRSALRDHHVLPHQEETHWRADVNLGPCRGCESPRAALVPAPLIGSRLAWVQLSALRLVETTEWQTDEVRVEDELVGDVSGRRRQNQDVEAEMKVIPEVCVQEA